jgi:predicted RNA-binding protein YlxR (DUF448 family)
MGLCGIRYELFLRITFHVSHTMAAKTITTKGPRPKHVPQRTCVACRTTGAKRGLIRIVRGTDGSVEVDETGKKSGRGAYLCHNTECWDKALKSKILEYALKTPISIEYKTALQAYSANLSTGE